MSETLLFLIVMLFGVGCFYTGIAEGKRLQRKEDNDDRAE